MEDLYCRGGVMRKRADRADKRVQSVIEPSEPACCAAKEAYIRAITAAANKVLQKAAGTCIIPLDSILVFTVGYDGQRVARAYNKSPSRCSGGRET